MNEVLLKVNKPDDPNEVLASFERQPGRLGCKCDVVLFFALKIRQSI